MIINILAGLGAIFLLLIGFSFIVDRSTIKEIPRRPMGINNAKRVMRFDNNAGFVEQISWCNANCTGPWAVEALEVFDDDTPYFDNPKLHMQFQFLEDADAVMFKLMFGGTVQLDNV